MFVTLCNINVPSAESYDWTVASKRFNEFDRLTQITELPAIYANWVDTNIVTFEPSTRDDKSYSVMVDVTNLSPETPVGPVCPVGPVGPV
jgi:hypothetical protein